MPIELNNNNLVPWVLNNVNLFIQPVNQIPQAVPAVPEAKNNFTLAEFPQFHEEMKKLKEKFPACRFTPVGSYETTKDDFVDVDVLMLCDENPSQHLIQNGWVMGAEYEAGISYKKMLGPDNVTGNIIWVHNLRTYENFQKAAMVCKHLNLTEKKDRILVHDVFMKKILKRNIWELEV